MYREIFMYSSPLPLDFRSISMRYQANMILIPHTLVRWKKSSSHSPSKKILEKAVFSDRYDIIHPWLPVKNKVAQMPENCVIR